MEIPKEYLFLLPLAVKWLEDQEKNILDKRTPLNENQKIDAYLVGVKDIDNSRIGSYDAI